MRPGPSTCRSSARTLVPACRAPRPRRTGSKWSNATRASTCGCRRDAGWPGKRSAHRALAVQFRRSHHNPRPWPFAGGGSGRVSRPPGRRPSSCDQCGSTAATVPRRGLPQARRPTALDGALSAFERAAWLPGRPAGCRGARRRERTSTPRTSPQKAKCAQFFKRQNACCRSPPAPIARLGPGPSNAASYMCRLIR